MGALRGSVLLSLGSLPRNLTSGFHPPAVWAVGVGGMGARLGVGGGFQQGPPHPQQRCAVISVFFLSLPSITPKDSQEMGFKATPWDAHPGPV